MRTHTSLATLILVSSLAAPVLAGCSAPVSLDEVGLEEAAATADPRALSATTMPTSSLFKAYSLPGGVLSTSGRSMKFLIDNRAPTRKTVNFLNGNYVVNGQTPSYARYHYDFARKQLRITEDGGTFNQRTYFTQKKSYFAGTLQTYVRGESQEPTYAVQFYPDDVISEGTILEALKFLKTKISIPGAKLAFVATGPQQTFATIGAEAAALGVELLTIDQVLGDIKYVGLNPGEAWGYLRIFPTSVDSLRPTDIPVFDELPLDLAVVAGVITKTYQDVNSHVNLKSKERNTPNMVLRDASRDHAQLAPWADKPVHFKVTSEGFLLEETTDAIIAAKLAERTNRPWVALPIVDETRLLSFDELCPSVGSPLCLGQSPKVGGKATGLGFLASEKTAGRAAKPGTLSARFGYDLTPRGFALPVKYYRDMLAVPENAALAEKVAKLAADEKAGLLAGADRTARSKEVQELFYRAQLPAGVLAAMTARLAEVTPGVAKFKLRSSATSEDVEGFNGAGLYDSFSAETDKTDNPDFACKLSEEVANGVVTKLKMKPKTVQCAIKGVYASLWNTRALSERSFARLDHETAGMGIAVNPSYDEEDAVAANVVLVTRVVNSDVYGYSLSVQKGNNLVTNPEPATLSEATVAAFSDPGRPPRFTTTRFAKPTAESPVLTTTVLTEAQMREVVDIAKTVEIAYCRAKPGYFSGSCSDVWLSTEKPRSLDMELKILENGHYVLKQVREFHGR